MKKLAATCFAVLLMTFAAGAANVGTIDNAYPGDTEAQAQMLYDLGLFRGTEKGFELEQPMTRAEAAVMLTRFLGAEQTALEGAWTHPFTDVPEWADPYIAWLYQSGLTRGVSATRYGAEESVTYGQYCTFLARASTDEESYDFLGVYGVDEEGDCDRAGFVRGDAVSLSARLLGEYYLKYEDTNGITVAQKLIDRGVFSLEQFKKAAWDVLPREYTQDTLHGFNDMDYRLSCVIAGVPVVRCADDEIDVIYYSKSPLNQLYGEKASEGQDYVCFRLDAETLEAEELLRGPEGSTAKIMGYAGGTDYLLLREPEGDTVYAVRGAETEAVLSLTKQEGSDALFSCLQGEDGCVFQASEDKFYRLDENGASALPLAAGDRLSVVLSSGLLLMENITAEHTVISGWSWDGEPAGSYTVENRYPLPEHAAQWTEDVLAYWQGENAPKLLSDNGSCAWGTAGLYRAEDGKLLQITDKPVYDCEIDPADGSYVLLTSPADERPGYYGAGVFTLAGTEAIRIAADGTETMLLANQPAHGLTFDRITCAEAGVVRVQYTYVMGMADYHSYEYAIENGRLRALVNRPGMGFSGYTEEECAVEQARLDALGVGVSS